MRPNNRLASALLAATALASCGGGDGGGGSAPPTAVAPTPTPSPTPAPSPMPTPTPSSFPVTADLQFSTRFSRLSYTGTAGENPLTGLESDGAFPGGLFTASPDLTNGTLRIEDNYLTRTTFAASQRQGEDTRSAVIYTYAGDDGARLRILNNSVRPVDSGEIPFVLRYTSFAAWTRQNSAGATVTTWQGFGFPTPSVALPTGTRRYAIGAVGDFILAFRDGTGIPYEVSGDGTLVVDFDRKTVTYDAVRFYFRPFPPRLGDLATQVSGSGTVGADGTVFGTFELPPGADMSGNPTDAYAAVRFSGSLYGPAAEEIGLTFTFVDPSPMRDPARRGYGAGAMVGRPLPAR